MILSFRKIAIFIMGFSLVASEENDTYNYNINLLGIPVANCIVSYSDTLLSGVGCKKLDYKVTTNAFIDKIFKIDNHYTVIIDTIQYNTLYYSKISYQPNIKNDIYTSLIDGDLKYSNSNISINKKDKNIFTVLYLFQSSNFNELNKIDYIEREGKYYNFNISEHKENQFQLLIEEINSNNFGAIKNTDIFLWGLFLNKSNNKIIMDNNNQHISKCVVNKGFTVITAKLR